jgi:carbon-monoxide dehydrogenase medium subunit
LKRFDYLAPEGLDEALAILRERGDGGRLLAGGTDLVVQMKEAGLRPSYVVSLRRLRDLRGIAFDEQQGLRIGAMTTMADIAEHPIIRHRYPVLVDGASIVGSVQTRNMASLGGNVCNAAPSADTAPPLLVLGAHADIAGAGGRRQVPLEGFFTSPGQTVLGRDEVLVGFSVPTPAPRTGGCYERHTPRAEMDIAVVGVAALVTLEPDRDVIREARIALGAVAPTPLRAPDAEASLAGQPPSDEAFERAAELAMLAARPISDVRGSAAFRRHLVRVMTARCLRRAVERARPSPQAQR